MGLRVKGIFVLAVLAGSIAAIMPTYQAYKEGGKPETIETKVNLGLDLQGGMYLDVEVDTQAAVTGLLDRLAVETEDLLLEKLIDYNSVERRGEVVEVALAGREKVDWQESPFDRMLRNFIVEEAGENTYRFKMSSDELERVHKRLTRPWK